MLPLQVTFHIILIDIALEGQVVVRVAEVALGLQRMKLIMLEVFLNLVNPLDGLGELLDDLKEAIFLDVVQNCEVHRLGGKQALIITENPDFPESCLHFKGLDEGITLLVEHGDLSDVDVVDAVGFVFLDEEVIVFDHGLLVHGVNHVCDHFDAELGLVEERDFGEDPSNQKHLNLQLQVTIKFLEDVLVFQLDLLLLLEVVIKEASDLESQIIWHTFLDHVLVNVHHLLLVLV